ncbi:MAG: hypothetical protein V1707_03060 [bacterium]
MFLTLHWKRLLPLASSLLAISFFILLAKPANAGCCEFFTSQDSSEIGCENIEKTCQYRKDNKTTGGNIAEWNPAYSCVNNRCVDPVKANTGCCQNGVMCTDDKTACLKSMSPWAPGASCDQFLCLKTGVGNVLEPVKNNLDPDKYNLDKVCCWTVDEQTKSRACLEFNLPIQPLQHKFYQQACADKVYQDSNNGYFFASCDSVDKWCGSQVATGFFGEIKPITFTPQVGIPFSDKFIGGKSIQVSNSMFAEYVLAVYSFSLAIAGLLAVIMIMYGGIRMVMSGGSAGEYAKAQGYIKNGVIGIVILLSAHTILSSISSRLVIFQPLTPKAIVSISQEEFTNFDNEARLEAEYADKAGAVPPTGQKYCVGVVPISIPGVKIVDNDGQTQQLLVNTLSKAVEEVKKTFGPDAVLQINSSVRTWEKQNKLYQCRLNYNQTNTCAEECGHCNKAARPVCTSPHMAGYAVDVCVGKLCGKAEAKYNTDPAYADDIKKLQQTMKNAGFEHICIEWWHFEYKNPYKPNMDNYYCEPGIHTE